MACDPFDSIVYNPGYVKALKPAGVDSLEMRVYRNDSLVATEYSRSSENGEEARFFFEDYCRSEERVDIYCDYTIAITLFCDDKKVDLPTYMVKTQTHDGVFADQVKFYTAEFDERKINGEYTIERFLAPEDTSCGKFVNYAVLKVEDQ